MADFAFTLSTLDGASWLATLTKAGLTTAALTDAGNALSEFTPTRFLGRLHPILVHFPIAIALLAAAVEASRLVRRISGLAPTTVPLLLVASLAAIASAGSGWLIAAWESPDDPSDTLFAHRWLGTVVALLLVGVTAIAYRATRTQQTLGGSRSSTILAAQFGTLFAAGLVGLVGHLGGELVYGEGYLFKGLYSRPRDSAAATTGSTADPARSIPVSASPEEAFYFASVRPILVQHCEECHGAEKQKGRLRLVPIGAAFAGSADDWTIIQGHPEESILIDRVLLPRDDPDAMPPEGKGRALTAEEIAVLEQWIKNGAVVPASERVAEEAVEVSRGESSTPAPPPATTKSQRTLAHVIDACTACGAIAMPPFEGSAELEVNASLAKPAWTDAQLAHLVDACDAIVALNLARSSVTDAGLQSLPSMPALQRLRLDETAIGDAGVTAMLDSPQLTHLNLVGTQLTDGGLEHILSVPSIRDIYLWRTRVTPEGVAKAKAMRPDVRIVTDGDE